LAKPLINFVAIDVTVSPNIENGGVLIAGADPLTKAVRQRLSA
jgi:hypothetical protein